MENKVATLNAGDEIETNRPRENQQRIGFLSSLPAILRSYGVNPHDVLASAGLSAHALDHPENAISHAKIIELLAVAAEQTASPHLGLLIGQEFRTDTLGVLGEAINSAPTLRAALQDFASNQHRYAPGRVAYLLEDKDQGRALFGTAAYEPDLPKSVVLADCLVMAAVAMVRELADPDHDPVVDVLLARTEPADTTPYREAFAVDIRFNAEQSAIVLSPSRLDQPMPSSDPVVHHSALLRARALRDAEELDIVTRLRRLLRVALLKGKVSANQISVQLGMSRRTLHRRLGAVGVHYQAILDETRCAFAQQLLADTSLRIGDIATIVGYTDPSALTRRFLRWTGVTPHEWRSTMRLSKPG